MEQARGFANYHENAIFGSKEVGGIDTFARVGTAFSTLTYQPVAVTVTVTSFSASPSPSSPITLVVTSPSSVTLVIALPTPVALTSRSRYTVVLTKIHFFAIYSMARSSVS